MADRSEKNVSVDISMENGKLVVKPHLIETWTAYCYSGDGQLYQGGSYKKALQVGQDHVDANPTHAVTVIGP